MRKQKLLSAATMLLITLFTPGAVRAHNLGTSGTCGENATYTVTGSAGNYTLTISGTGDIAYGAFLNLDLSGITRVVINEGITGIGSNAFNNGYDINTEFTSLSIPASVTYIGQCAFSECHHLSTVTIATGSKLQSIGYGVFENCYFPSIVLPCAQLSSVDCAFSREGGYQNLSEIICLTETALSVNENEFYHNRDQVTVYMLGSQKVGWSHAKAVKGLVTSVVKGTGVSSLSADYSTATTKTAGGKTYYVGGSTVKLTLSTSLSGSGVVFRANGVDLEKGSDGKYTLILPDDATVVTVTASIPQSISGATVTLAQNSYSYDGTPKEPAVNSVRLGGKTLAAGTDYSVSYSNNTLPGTATVTVRGKGTYGGTATAHFTINAPSISGVTYNTTAGCYDIGTVAQFRACMAYAQSEGGEYQLNCEGLKFRLTANIGSAGNPVGDIEPPYIFRGIFDGNNHTIYGVNISANTIPLGLFCILRGEVRNLTLSGINVDTPSTRSGGVGSIAGHSSGIVENCHVTGTLTGKSVTGGIIGVATINVAPTEDTWIKDCSFSGTIKGYLAGGILGHSMFNEAGSCRVSGCTVTDSSIEAQNCVGGIVGTVFSGTTCYVSDCKVAATSIKTRDLTGISRGVICGDSRGLVPSEHVSGCVYHCDDMTLKGIGFENSDTGCTRFYGVTCTKGVTATYVSGTKTRIGDADYYDSGATFSVGTGTGVPEGYTTPLLSYYVTDSDSNSISLNNNQFTLPKSNATVSGRFTPDPAHFSNSGDTYTIHTVAGWNVFCDQLNDHEKGYFSGKTVKLADNFNNATSPVTRMAGKRYYDFTGRFDGNGKTLYICYGSSTEPIAKENAAPFPNVENGCIIENLHVAGDIYTSNKYAAGIVGTQYGTVDITNCHSSVIIHSYTEGDGTHGGIVGVSGNSSSSKLTLTGCLFDGKLLSCGTAATTKSSGFVGWQGRSVTINHSVYAPAALEPGETEISEDCATFARNGVTSITNCYYTRALGTEQGVQARPSSSKPANIGKEISSKSANWYTAYEDGLYYNGLYYSQSPEYALSLTAATLFGEHKYVTTLYNGTLDLRLPEGAKAYTANLDGTDAVFHLIGEDGQVIPQGTAAIIVSDTESITLTSTETSVNAYEGNILQGADSQTAKPAGTVYVLNIRGGVLGFYPFSGSTIPAGKAYYVVE